MWLALHSWGAQHCPESRLPLACNSIIAAYIHRALAWTLPNPNRGPGLDPALATAASCTTLIHQCLVVPVPRAPNVNPTLTAAFSAAALGSHPANWCDSQYVDVLLGGRDSECSSIL